MHGWMRMHGWMGEWMTPFIQMILDQGGSQMALNINVNSKVFCKLINKLEISALADFK